MEIAYYGRGRVGSACREVIDRLGIETVSSLSKADFLISVHWDKIFTAEQLRKPRYGALNLHNSYLPWNRGAHSCTWAIVDKTPHGVTMHWMDEHIDTGDIFYQEFLGIEEGETADDLYQRTAQAEVRVFERAIRRLMIGDRTRTPQKGAGSFHKRADFSRLMRAVTTSDCVAVWR